MSTDKKEPCHDCDYQKVIGYLDYISGVMMRVENVLDKLAKHPLVGKWIK